MEVHFNPDLQAQFDKLVIQSGRATGKGVEDVVAGYSEELAQTREMLNSRYDDLESGKVKTINGEEAFARLKEKTEGQRNRSASTRISGGIRPWAPFLPFRNRE